MLKAVLPHDEVECLLSHQARRGVLAAEDADEPPTIHLNAVLAGSGIGVSSECHKGASASEGRQHIISPNVELWQYPVDFLQEIADLLLRGVEVFQRFADR
jgi:hypothetical protein